MFNLNIYVVETLAYFNGKYFNEVYTECYNRIHYIKHLPTRSTVSYSLNFQLWAQYLVSLRLGSELFKLYCDQGCRKPSVGPGPAQI